MDQRISIYSSDVLMYILWELRRRSAGCHLHRAAAAVRGDAIPLTACTRVLRQGCWGGTAVAINRFSAFGGGVKVGHWATLVLGSGYLGVRVSGGSGQKACKRHMLLCEAGGT